MHVWVPEVNMIYQVQHVPGSTSVIRLSFPADKFMTDRNIVTGSTKFVDLGTCFGKIMVTWVSEEDSLAVAVKKEVHIFICLLPYGLSTSDLSSGMCLSVL